MIVTIDGPAGAGKSTIARELAKRLGFQHLDTGAMYRAVTWAAMERGIDLQDETALAELARSITISLDSDRVLVDGIDVTEKIRDPEVTRHVGLVADSPRVREHLVRLQRAITQKGDFVSEGRDQGTVVFPDAEFKIFLTASDTVRARRRAEQLRQAGLSVDESQILQEIRMRDERDMNRKVGRLQKAEDAIEYNTDNKTIEEIVNDLAQMIHQRAAQKRASE